MESEPGGLDSLCTYKNQLHHPIDIILVQKYKKFGFYKTVLLYQSRILAGLRVLDDRII